LLSGDAAGGDKVVLGVEVARRRGGRGGGGEESALEEELYGGGGAVERKDMVLEAKGKVFLEAEHGGGSGGGSARLRPLCHAPLPLKASTSQNLLHHHQRGDRSVGLKRII
jgi:hypothetical protein